MSSIGTAIGRLSSLATGAMAFGNPVTASFKGARLAGGFLFQTTIGRIMLFLVVFGIGFTMFKAHFTSWERAQWTTAVTTKQGDINRKVTIIEQETRERQENARKNISITDSILAVITGQLWKLDDKHKVDGEIIDLINETRDVRNARGSAEGAPMDRVVE